jgi:phosphotransferase system HPr-like phosphotransfer protein
MATLAAACGARLELETNGPDADAALDALIALVACGFVSEINDGQECL